MLNISISYWDLIKFPYFADTTERRDREVETERIGGEREGDFTDNSIGCPKFKPVLWGYENWHKPSTGYEAVLYSHNLCSQKIRELVLVLRANSHKFSTSKTKRNTLSQTTCSLLKHCQICKNDFLEKIHHISTQFLFLGGGGWAAFHQCSTVWAVLHKCVAN
jgi:hypothetical protein